ncbi:hypothetical protein GCM10009641_80820 [Mycobacterium cookii]|uniref:NUDIX hydrolase n=1 Tax=Nocardioides furvisabuli TaxID=375542 RepID=A0ABN2XFC4_9ACTN|nr:hypothetical protein [Nocardioides furvisabuli]
MEAHWWVTLVRAWPQDDDGTGIVIRMISSSLGEANGAREIDEISFVSIDEAVDRLRAWLVTVQHAGD